MTEELNLMSHSSSTSLEDRLANAEKGIHGLALEQKNQGNTINELATMTKDIHEALVGDQLDPDDTKGLVKKVKSQGEAITKLNDSVVKLKEDVRPLKSLPQEMNDIKKEVKVLKDVKENEKTEKINKYEGFWWGILGAVGFNGISKLVEYFSRGGHW